MTKVLQLNRYIIIIISVTIILPIFTYCAKKADEKHVEKIFQEKVELEKSNSNVNIPDSIGSIVELSSDAKTAITYATGDINKIIKENPNKSISIQSSTIIFGKDEHNRDKWHAIILYSTREKNK
jgi:hypothetical protein